MRSGRFAAEEGDSRQDAAAGRRRCVDVDGARGRHEAHGVVVRGRPHAKSARILMTPRPRCEPHPAHDGRASCVPRRCRLGFRRCRRLRAAREAVTAKRRTLTTATARPCACAESETVTGAPDPDHDQHGLQRGQTTTLDRTAHGADACDWRGAARFHRSHHITTDGLRLQPRLGAPRGRAPLRGLSTQAYYRTCR